MALGNSVNYGLEVILKKVQIRQPDMGKLAKLCLTVISPQGGQICFSHLVRSKTVSFYDQSIKMANCQSFIIRVGKLEKANAVEIPLGSFRVQVSKLRAEQKMDKMRAKLYAEIPQAKCVVYYDVALFDTQLFQDTRLSEQIVPDLERKSGDDTAGKGMGIQGSPTSKEKKSFQSSDSPIEQTPEFHKESRPSDQFQKNSGEQDNGNKVIKTVTENHEDQIVQNVQQTKTRPPNRFPKPLKVTPLKHTQSANIPIRTPVEQLEEEIMNLSASRKVIPIRSKTMTRAQTIGVLESKVENIYFQLYMYEESNKAIAKFNQKIKKLESQIKSLQKQKHEKLKKQKEQFHKPGFLASKVMLFIAILSGIIASIIFNSSS